MPISSILKVTVCISIIIFSLNIQTSFAFQSFPPTFKWDLNDSCYLNFNSSASFSENPHLGISNDSSLVGCWGLNEGSGSFIHDYAGINNGTMSGAKWTTGKQGSGLSFNGTTSNYIKFNNSAVLQVTGDLTLSCWVYLNNLSTKQTLIYKNWDSEYELSINTNGNLEFDHKSTIISSTLSPIMSNSWLHIVVIRNVTAKNVCFYVNGLQIGSSQNFTTIPVTSTNPVFIGQESGYNPLNGTIDDVRIYNRALNANEVALLFNQGEQPDYLAFASFCNFTDSGTNSTMLIHANTLNSNSNDSLLITVVNFFNGKKLSFQANGTGTVNIWTNLGEPISTTGIWNSQNFTTTFSLDSFSISQLIWVRTTPVSSNLTISSVTANAPALIFSLWNDSFNLSSGGYILSTNNSGQWQNTSWVPFQSSPAWGNATLTLNGTANVNVGFQEYANNSFNSWSYSEVLCIKIVAAAIIPTPTTNPSQAPAQTGNKTQSSESTTINIKIRPIISPTPKPSLTVTSIPPLNASYNNDFIAGITLVFLIMAIVVCLVITTILVKKRQLTLKITDESQTECSDDASL